MSSLNTLLRYLLQISVSNLSLGTAFDFPADALLFLRASSRLLSRRLVRTSLGRFAKMND
jgi:hypothetical protein